jgi:hypothetical protein
MGGTADLVQAAQSSDGPSSLFSRCQEVLVIKPIRAALLLVLLALFALYPAPAARARPLRQSVSLVAEVSPNPDGTLYIHGTVTASGLHPEGQQIVTNHVYVSAQFMGATGTWHTFYEWFNYSKRCYTIGERCATEEEKNGDQVVSVSLLSQALADEADGQAISFEGDVAPPEGAQQMRVVAQLHHTYTSAAAYWTALQYLWDVVGPQPVVLPPTATPTPSPSPTPTTPAATWTPPPTDLGTTATPGPCALSVQPASAHIQPGESLEITGTATRGGGQSVAGARVDVTIPGLAGSGYVSSARTDAQGRFRILYTSPLDVGGAAATTLTVRVEGCQGSANVRVNFGPTPTPTATPTAVPSPTPTGTFTPQPTATDTPTPSPSPTPECPSAEEAMRTLLDMYAQLSLDGRDYGLGSGNGPYCNTRSWHPPHGTQLIGSVDGKSIYVQTRDAGCVRCGDYQGGILDWLDALRESPTHGHLLTGGPGCPNLVEYCPIMSYGGVHHAIIIYPSGSSWRKEGVVLDPWYVQRAKTYPIGGWDSFAAPDALYAGQYPCTGGTGYAVAPGQRPPVRDRRGKTQLLARCPVDVLISDARGDAVGRTAEGLFVNQIPEAEFLAHPEEDGTLLWYFSLPGAGRYEATITGTGDGSFGLVTRHGDGPLQAYGEQPIASAVRAELTLDPAQPAAPLLMANGRVVQPKRGSAVAAADLLPVPLALFGVGALAGLGALILLLVLLLRRRAAVAVPAAQPMAPPPGSRPPQSGPEGTRARGRPEAPPSRWPPRPPERRG